MIATIRDVVKRKHTIYSSIFVVWMDLDKLPGVYAITDILVHIIHRKKEKLYLNNHFFISFSAACLTYTKLISLMPCGRTPYRIQQVHKFRINSTDFILFPLATTYCYQSKVSIHSFFLRFLPVALWYKLTCTPRCSTMFSLLGLEGTWLQLYAVQLTNGFKINVKICSVLATLSTRQFKLSFAGVECSQEWLL